ncbi:MAG: branched-chain amino acid ABC transporter permease [Deltaproteobacteria bacterium]|nr:MAG: branched-chain amino acid ABC transporter permease [Deltaproteobacteria bacterium]
MHYCGDYRTTYEQDSRIFQTGFVRFWFALFMGFMLVFPFVATNYLLSLMIQILIAVIGAVGLNLLTGFTGQISLGHGAFLGVGAYTTGVLTTKLGVPFWVSLPAAGLMAAFIGMFVGIPSLRLKGLYLAIATLASQFILEWIFLRWEPVTGGSYGMILDRPKIGSFVFEADKYYYFIVLAVTVAAVLFAKNLVRTRTGRAFMAVRDHYISAEIMGIDIFKYKLLSFGISSFYAGIAGALMGHYLMFISSEQFTILVSIQYLAMIIIGGLGSIIGSIYGAVFMVLLPEVLTLITSKLSWIYPNISDFILSIQDGVFGLIIVLFLIFEPDGLAHRWNLIKAYWKLYPFSY